MTSYARFLDVAADNSNEKNAVKDMVGSAPSMGTGSIQSKPMQNVISINLDHNMQSKQQTFSG